MGGALRLRQTEAPRQEGELARLKVVRGPDRGSTFIITAPRITLGRGEDNDIILTDIKASRRHAAITCVAEQSSASTSRGADRGWSVQDLGSANGISWNGKATRSASLKPRDTIGLGDTILEFITSEVGTAMLAAPPVSETQLQKERVGMALQKAKIAALSQFGGLAKNALKVDMSPTADPGMLGGVPGSSTRRTLSVGAGAKGKGGKNNNIIFIIAAVIGAYFLILSGGDQPRQQGKKDGSGDASRVLASMTQGLAPGQVTQLERNADVFFKEGFREYTQHNWLRAKSQFETVLQIIPGQPLAARYHTDCEKEIDREVKKNLEVGRNSMETGKLREAKGSFEAVLRLKYQDPASPDYAQAKTLLDQVNAALAAPIASSDGMGGGGG